MVDAITSVLVSIVEAVVARRGKLRDVSASKALYFMFLSINSIVEEADAVLVQIELRLAGRSVGLPKELEERLLEIYRQTQVFLHNASHIAGPHGLLQFFDRRADKLTELSYRHDMSLFWALDRLVATLRRFFQNEGAILDFDPMLAPDLVYELAALLNDDAAIAVAKIRKTHEIHLTDMKETDALSDLLVASRARVAELRSCAAQLGTFIGENCTIADFVTLKKGDLKAWTVVGRLHDEEIAVRDAEERANDARARARTLAGSEAQLLRRVRDLEDTIARAEGKPFVETLGHLMRDGKCRSCGCSAEFIEHFRRPCEHPVR